MDTLDTYLTSDEALVLADHNRVIAASYRKIAENVAEPEHAEMASVLCAFRQGRAREWTAVAAETDADEEASVERIREDEFHIDPLAASRGVVNGLIVGVVFLLLLAFVVYVLLAR